MLIKSKAPKQGIFSSKPKAPETDLTSVYYDINEIGRSLRVLEQRYLTLQNKAQITEQNVINKNKQLSNEIKTINLEIHELKSEIDQLKDQILMIIKELKSTAKLENLRVIEKYLNYWEPIKFVTHDEVEELVKHILENIEDSK